MSRSGRGPKHRAGGGRSQQSRAVRILVWAVIIVFALTSLFYVFEFVVPRLLPENF
jgi:hypothetical protein